MRSSLCLLLCSWSLVAGASLHGSKSALKKQNEEADHEDLTRIENDAQLARFKRAGRLVKITETKYLVVDPRLDEKWRYVRPQVVPFLRDVSREYYVLFHEPIQINSAVRTAEYQRQLRKDGNGNATAADGKTRSSHLTGATVDIAKKDMSSEEKKWIQKKLLALEKRNLVEATEERKQPCFHVMIFKTYPASSTPPAVRKKRT